MSSFEDVIFGRSTQPRVTPTPPAEGRVLSVANDGMRFTIPTWDSGRHVFGPAPWPATVVVEHTSADDTHTHEVVQPKPGDRCLVVFVGIGIKNPWVIGWWPA